MIHYSRRRLLKTGVSASGIFLLKPFDKFISFLSGTNEIPTWSQLVEVARWCPTIHNLQPHQLKIISETEADLYYDPKRLLPVGDPEAVFVTIAMSMFLEHLSIVAHSFGYAIQIVGPTIPIDIKATVSTKFTRLKLVPTEQKEPLDSSLIYERRTSRLHYDGRPLQENTIQKIGAEAAKFNQEFNHSSDPEIVDFIIELNQQSLFEDLASTKGREELHRLFRYTDQDAAKFKDGLWYKAMAFPGKLMRNVFSHHEHWEKGLKKKMLGNYYRDSFKGTASICWFKGNFQTPADWMNAGKMFARSWLLLTKDKAFLHPFGSLITNQNAHESISKKLNPLGQQDSEDTEIWMIFRAGFSKEPVRSYRLSTKEIIIN
ncbi:MAG: hypothetical protein RLZZ65_519 [Bacteroidota bacterium]|jgi:hypothetical protein